ncbi:hypothetical protein AHF37_06362 [Paragonimus kellicotti]|nr:hypothetical protein AHF37_06362 [Paragonimus kellicotti]
MHFISLPLILVSSPVVSSLLFACSVVGPTVIPQRQTVYPYGSFQVECRSDRPGVEPSLTVENGTSVDRLPRFQVTRPSLGVIVVRLTNLTERDRGLRLRCYYPTGESTTAEIIIESPCESHERMCRDGTCVREDYFCNGREDCRDGSDERPPHCGLCRHLISSISDRMLFPQICAAAPPGCRPDQFTCLSGDCISLTMHCDGRQDCSDGSDERNCGLVPIIRPGKPVIRPYEIYELECTSNQMGVRPDIRLFNGTPVENLPTFTVNRPRLETVIVRTSSLTERDNKLVIHCLESRYFCNGQEDCSDGSDERPPHCTIQGPTIKTDRPTVQPYGSVEIRCESHQFGIRPELRVANGTSVEDLKRFIVNRPSLQMIIARLTDVTEADRGLLLRRSLPAWSVRVWIRRVCGCTAEVQWTSGLQRQIRRDGLCYRGGGISVNVGDLNHPRCKCLRASACEPFQGLNAAYFNPLRTVDKSGSRSGRWSGHAFCIVLPRYYRCWGVIGPTIRPERPVVHPYESLDIECFSGRTGTRPELRVSNGTLLGQLDRFHVFRPSLERVVARLDMVTEQDTNMVIM